MNPDTVPDTVQPGRNGGTLLVGNPGNKGGLGNPPSEIRRKARETFAQYMDRIESKVSDDTLSMGELCKAADVSGKYGMGEKTFDISEDEIVSQVNLFTSRYFLEIGNAEAYDGWIKGLREHFKNL